MKQFKFLGKPPIAKTNNGESIYVEEYFYTMNKEEMIHAHNKIGKISVTPKYTIVQRFIPKKYEDVFKPNYNLLWYFKTKEEAEHHRWGN